MSRCILILTNRIPYPLHDGGALAMDAMIRGYQQAGWQVHLLAMNTTRHFVTADLLGSRYTDLAGFYTVTVDNNISTLRILKNLLFSREPEHIDRFRSKAFEEKLTEILKRIHPDVVQLESPFLASYIPLIRQIIATRIVYRAHNIEEQIWSRLAGESKGLKRIYLNILAKRMSRSEAALWQHADLILPITEADAAIIRGHGTNTPIITAPFGIKTSRTDIDLPPSPFRVYHIGAMDWLPNQEALSWFLKEVWPLLHQRAPDIEFHFAGRGMPSSFGENLPEGVFCHHEVPDAKAFIADKHMLAVPLRSGSGIRVKTLEAMAAGKLVVSTDIGMQGIEAIPDLHYLRADTAALFADLIVWAAAHRENAEAITHRAQRLIREHYDADVIMHRIINGVAMTKPQ
jgi:glycosyltransferase involved in cell wall biosynthesis